MKTKGLNKDKLYVLDLFTGGGGGCLAGQYLLGWETVGYVEFEESAQEILKARIRDRLLHNAPIWSDIRSFTKRNNATKRFIRGLRSIRNNLVISGGFPCQPFSTAGKRKGKDDNKNMWPDTLRLIGEIRPKYCFLENVPGIINSGYIATIAKGLAEIGYDCKWTCLSFARIGGSHKRERVWIVAHPRIKRWEENSDVHKGVKYIDYIKKPEQSKIDIQPYINRGRHEVNTSDVRINDAMAGGLDRIKAAGNGQVPIVAAIAWGLLTDGIGYDEFSKIRPAKNGSYSEYRVGAIVTKRNKEREKQIRLL